VLWSFCEIFSLSFEELTNKFRYSELRLMALASRIQYSDIMKPIKTEDSPSSSFSRPKKSFKQMTKREVEEYYGETGVFQSGIN